MKQTKSILVRHKMTIITLVLVLAVILIAMALRFNVLEISSTSEITLLNAWIRQHTFILLLCHVLLAAAIYVYWSVKVDCLVRQSHFFAENAKKIKSIRWVIIGAIIAIDLVVFYLR